MSVDQTLPSILNVAKTTITCEKLWLPVHTDFAGNAITNSNGRLPVKPHYELYSIGVYHIKIFKGYSHSAYANELDTICSVPRFGFSQYQCWLSEIHVSSQKTIGPDTGYEVHYVVRCIKRPNGWRFQHPDVGWIYTTGAVDTPFKASSVPFIGNLDGSGDAGSTMQVAVNDTKQLLDFSSITGL